MKTRQETNEVISAARAELAAGRSCAIVVLVRVKGSSFRRPGAKLLVRADGTMSGNVSGGCLENDLKERALAAIIDQQQHTVHYDTGSDEDVIWGLGLGCDGELDLLIVPLIANKRHDWIDDVWNRLQANEPVVLSWTFEQGPARAPGLFPATSQNEFCEHLEPTPSLLVIGAGDDSIPLVELAAGAGFRVTVIDHRSGYLDAARFPRAHALTLLRPEKAGEAFVVHHHSMVVIKNHALEMDKKWAKFFDGTDACYIGLLGPKKRVAELRSQMTSGRMDRLYGPAGLDLGGEGAEHIALAIVAELLTVWSKRSPRHLRDREGAIHGG